MALIQVLMMVLAVAFANDDGLKFCKREIDLLCQKTPPPTKANHYECLSEFFNELSDGCQKGIDESLKDLPCRKDERILCQGKDRKLSRSFQCLRLRSQEASPECQKWIAAQLTKAAAKTKEADEACSVDRLQCASKKGKEEGLCMDSLYWAGKLSPGCRKIIETYRIKREAK